MLQSREIKELESIATVVYPNDSSKESFLGEVSKDHSDAIAIYSTNGNKVGGYNKEVIEGLPKSIKYICSNGESFVRNFRKMEEMGLGFEPETGG